MFEPRPREPAAELEAPTEDEVFEEAADETADEAPEDATLEIEEIAGFDEGGVELPGEGPAGDEPTPRRRREKSILGRLTIGTAFIAVGFMAVLDSAGVAHPAFSHYMALMVGIIGLGLIVGSVMGRSRGLILLGLFLVPVLLVSSVVTASFAGGWGERVYRPASVAEVEAEYGLTGGDLVLDLRSLDLGSDELRIEGDVGFGRLLVIVPDGVAVDARAHVGFGDVQVFGEHRSGVDVDRSVFVDGRGLVELHLDVGFGELEIREVSR